MDAFIPLMALHRNTPKTSNYVITPSAETKALLPGLTYNATSTVGETVGKIWKKTVLKIISINMIN